MAYSEAEKQVATVEALENQIQELRTSFSEFETSNRQLTKNLTDADEVQKSCDVLYARRQDMNEAISQLRADIRQAGDQWRAVLATARAAHKARWNHHYLQQISRGRMPVQDVMNWLKWRLMLTSPPFVLMLSTVGSQKWLVVVHILRMGQRNSMGIMPAYCPFWKRLLVLHTVI